MPPIRPLKKFEYYFTAKRISVHLSPAMRWY